LWTTPPIASGGSLLALLPLLAASLRANEELCVVVRDPSGLPAAGASITVEPRVAAAVLRGAAGQDGRYCTPIAPGEHVIRVSRDGLMGAAAAATLPAGGGRVEREFVLRMASVASQAKVTAPASPRLL
jgi:hypothetical protein